MIKYIIVVVLIATFMFLFLPKAQPVQGAVTESTCEELEPSPKKKIITKEDIIKYIKTKDWDSNIAIAVMMSESSGKIKAYNINRDGSIDRGLFQINSKWHPKVTVNCAYSYKCNIDQAYLIYKARNSSFKPWYGYLQGNYKKFL